MVLNVNGLNIPIIRQRISKSILKHQLTVHSLEENHLKCNVSSLKIKG